MRLKVILAFAAAILMGCSSTVRSRPAPVVEASATEKVASAWKVHQYIDDFDGPVKESYVWGEHTNRTSLYIVDRLGKTTIKIRTDANLSGGIVMADLIIDGERINGVALSVSADYSWLVFQSATDYWIRKMDEGRSLKIRFKDYYERARTHEFDITGNTYMRQPKKIQ